MATLAIDSSVVVAAFAAWHERHEAAVSALDDDPSVPAHALLESYSVLTRLPPPLRAPAPVVSEFLTREFPAERRVVLPAAEQRSVVERLHGAGIEGGAVYDGLLALTASAAGATLLTLDRRALETYQRCAVEARLLGG